MKILTACEFSGSVRDAFAARGHDAWSCDLLDSEQPGNHIAGDVLDILGDLPISERAALRSRTFQGFAEAMAEQWG